MYVCVYIYIYILCGRPNPKKRPRITDVQNHGHLQGSRLLIVTPLGQGFDLKALELKPFIIAKTLEI